MTTYNKASLKTYFETNDVPAGSDYANLIDSQVNLVETAVQSMAGPLSTTELITPQVSATSINVTGKMSAQSICVETLSANTFNAANFLTISSRAGETGTTLTTDGSANSYWDGASTGLVYGEFQAHEISQVIVISAQSVPHMVISSALAGGLCNNTSFAGHQLTVQKKGVYEVNWSMSIDASAAAAIQGGITINDVAVTSKGVSHAYVAVGEQANAIFSTALVSCAVSAAIGLYVENHTGAANLTVGHVALAAHMVGGV